MGPDNSNPSDAFTSVIHIMPCIIPKYIDEFASPLYAPLPSFPLPGSRHGEAEGATVWTKSESLLHFHRHVSRIHPAFANPCLLEAIRCGFYRDQRLRQPILRESCPRCRQYVIEVSLAEIVSMRPPANLAFDGSNFGRELDAPRFQCCSCSTLFLIVDICVGRPSLKKIDAYDDLGENGGGHCFVCPLVAESFGRCSKELSLKHCIECHGHFESGYRFCPLCKNL